MKKIIIIQLAILIGVFLISCSTLHPSVNEKMDIHKQANDESIETYRVYYIPLILEYYIGVNADEVEKLACYVFDLKSKEMDTLFKNLNKKKEQNRGQDFRVKVINMKTNKSIYISDHSKIFSHDTKYIYMVPQDYIDAAFIEIKKIAQTKKKVCRRPASPDPPSRCHPADNACLKEERQKKGF